MGPLFAFGFLAIIGGISVVVVFLVAKLFLKFWPAVRLAITTTATGGIATVAAVFALAPFYPETLTGNEPEIFLGTAAVIGALAAVAAGWITLRPDRRRGIKSER